MKTYKTFLDELKSKELLLGGKYLQTFADEGDPSTPTTPEPPAPPVVNAEELNRIKELEKKIAVEDWKKENLQSIIDTEVAKKTNPNETPEQKRIRELEQSLEEMKSSKEKADMFDGVMTKTLEDGNIKMSPEIIKEFVIKDTPQETDAAYGRLNDFIKDIVKEQVEAGVNERFQRQATSFQTNSASASVKEQSLAEKIAKGLSGSTQKNKGLNLWA